jgi:hypothetical protein
MFFLDPYDMDTRGIAALENAGSPTLKAAKLPR